jgi:DNA-binding CsgD family transcriptional regulator
LIWKIISMLGGKTPAVPAPRSPEQLPEPLSQAEVRVLRFLPTSLSAPEIARELYVSVNTVRMHMRHLYDKLGAHRRLEAIDRARALGLLTLVPQSALALISAGRIQGGAWVPVCEPLHGLLRSAEKSLDPACPNWMATTSGVRQSGEFAQCGNAIARDHGGGPRMADECYAWKIRYLMQALATSYPARSISLCIVEIFT